MTHDFFITGQCERNESPEKEHARLQWLNAKTFAQMACDEMTRSETAGDSAGASKWADEYYRRLTLRSRAFDAFLNS